MPSLYLINPATGFPSYHTAEAFQESGYGWVQVADLAITTVAALAPPGWTIRLTDEGVSPVDFDHPADFIGITGKVSQRSRMFELAEAFRQRGQTVIIGGSFASLSPEDVRPHADILVTGEIEDIASGFFADLANGNWKASYHGGKTDLRRAPVPRWDLYPVHAAQAGAVQTTRGCPFNCEFCDVIQYQGRIQRHKDIEQVLTELDVLYAAGFRRIFIVDDNFTVHRKQARSMLVALAEWNARQSSGRVHFITQASLDIARDDDLLDLCHAAGLDTLFVGIETTNVLSLRETSKRQNLLLPIPEAISKILSRGVVVQAGIIVGFDNDGPEIFTELMEFFRNSPLPDLNIGALTAPQATRLYSRLKSEGRLLGDSWDVTAGSPFATNILPSGMSREDLLGGLRWLCETAYSPAEYERRMINLIEAFPANDGPFSRGRPTLSNPRGKLFLRTLQMIGRRGAAEAAMVQNVLRRAAEKPAALPAVIYFLGRYEQTRYFLEAEQATESVQAAE